MVEIDSALQNYAEELDDRMSAERMDEEVAEFVSDPSKSRIAQKLLSYGVIFPYADAFAYKTKGILLLGEGGIGKTPLAQEFVRKFKTDDAQMLAQDLPSLYKPPQEPTAPIVYLDDRKKKSEEEDYSPSIAPFAFPHCVPEFPVSYLFHLRHKSGKKGHTLREGKMGDAIEWMMFTGAKYKKTAENIAKIIDMFTRVRCFDVLKEGGYPRKIDLPELILGVQEILDADLK